MKKYLYPVSVVAVLLAACSPAAYEVNPPSVAEADPEISQEITEEIPESQKVGYMRIVGDLRWDQLTSKEEWMKRFPECLAEWGSSMLWNYFEGYYEGERKCKNFSAGSIPLNIRVVTLSSNSGTKSKTMTDNVVFSFYDASQSRAFKAALAQKYSLTSDGHCSKFTCWDLNDVNQSGDISAKPTPYAISILDQVQLNKDDL